MARENKEGTLLPSKRSPRRSRPARQSHPGPRSRNGERRLELLPGVYPVVAVGASAGGLEAFTKLLESLPAQSGMAFVLIQHLDPTHQSMLVNLLSRHTAMPVAEVVEGTKLELEHVYVIPPRAHLSIANDVLHLTTEPGDQGARFPLDSFLASLAENCGERAVAVILTGTGTDGSVGLRAINEHGGLVIAQEPTDAAYDGMPLSAIATGAVDLVLPLAKIPEALVSRSKQTFGVELGRKSSPYQEPDKVLAEIVALLGRKVTRDFTPYKQTTLLRRVQRRMAICGAHTVGDYLLRLKRDQHEATALAKDMLIHVTRFFRDSSNYKNLVATIIPDLVHHQPADQALRIWVPGCSTGEEAYSLAMLFFEAARNAKRELHPQIFATDVDEEAIASARRGLYPEAIRSEITQDRLDRFFVKEDRAYRVSAQLRDAVLFTIHDVLNDAPFSRLDMISCRNLLVYLRPEVQRKVIALFQFALRQGGFLVLGTSETPADATDLFTPVSPASHVYRKIGESRLPTFEFPRSGFARANAESSDVGALTGKTAAKLGNSVAKLLAEDYAPASVVVNSKHESLYHFGPVDRFLKVADGENSRDVFAMARGGLGPKLRVGLRQAARQHAQVTLTRCAVRSGAKPSFATVTIKPVLLEGQSLFLVSLIPESEGKPKATPSKSAPAESARITELENEVASTRTELERTIQDLETANEELRASNEEGMSINEEFRSTNEELQTSKEELQSLNEELRALNSQLQEAVDRQRKTSNDLQNVLNSSEIATVFLDRDLNIRFLTPAAKQSFGLLSSDVGRPLANLSLSVTDLKILDDARLVLSNLTPLHREITTADGACYMCRVMPYRTDDDHIEGVVITFNDVSEMKAVEIQSRDAQVYAESIISTISEPLIVLDDELHVHSASPSFYRYFGATPADTIGRSLQDSDARHLDIPSVIAFIEEIRRGATEIEEHQIEIEVPKIGRRTVWLSAREIPQVSGAKRKILIGMQDVTERVEIERTLSQAREAADNANRAKSRFLAAASHDLRQPLQTLRLLRGMLEQKVTDADTLMLLRRSNETLDAIGGMLDSILGIHQLENGSIHPRISSFPINDVLGRMQREFAVHAQTVGLEWRVVACRKIIRSDQRLLEEMIRNLLTNALKYTVRGKVLLGCRSHSDRLSIEVWDTGRGISQSDLQHIFEEFHQIDANLPADRERGLGLGLSIVQRLGETLRHPINVSSRVGRGSVFAITVPVVHDMTEVAMPPVEAGVANLEYREQGTIFVVEDDAALRETLEMFLRGIGHSVVGVGGGAQALDLISQAGIKPDVVLADYTLPSNQTGLGIIDAIRAATKTKVPAVILTGDVSGATLEAIRRSGNPYLLKPAKAEVISAVIGQLLSTVQPEPPPHTTYESSRGAHSVFVVEDDSALRETLATFLQQKGYHVAAFSSGVGFLRYFQAELKGCLLLDLKMPGMDGIEVLRTLDARGSALVPVMVTGKGDISAAVDAMKAGALEFLEKPVSDAKLLEVIDQALARATAASNDAEQRTLAMRRMASLTKRQHQILDLIIEGHANKEIAARLGISQRTVESHRALIMKHMGASSFAELVRLAAAAKK